MAKIFVALFAIVALAACAAPATPMQPTAPASSAAAIASSSASPASCATNDAAPPDKFRSDDPAKLASNKGKPKLVEFFAYW